MLLAFRMLPRLLMVEVFLLLGDYHPLSSTLSAPEAREMKSGGK